MKEEWLMFGAAVPVDVETTAALVAEVRRLIDVVGGLILKQGPDYERGFVDGMQKQMQSSVDKAVNRMAQPAAQPEQKPMAFKIYLPTAPSQQVNQAKLPWVYDQDRSSGNVASMWVTPVATLPRQLAAQPKQILNGAGKPTLSSDHIFDIASNYFADEDAIIKCGAAIKRAFEEVQPAAQPVPLTDGQILKILDDNSYDEITFARAIEAAHGIGVMNE